MDEITQAVLAYDYRDARLAKQVWICRRTKNRRIKDKAFNRLFWVYLEETGKAVRGVVVNGRKGYLLRFVGFMEKEDGTHEKVEHTAST